jgi:hypothetical protein
MVGYRVICIVRGSGGEIEAVGYSRNGNGVIYDERWTIGQLREAIEEGKRLYVVDSSTGDQAELEVCGDGIRVRGAGDTKAGLDGLPECG